jgi:hypothetical protein
MAKVKLKTKDRKQVDSILAANRGKEFVERMFEKKTKSIPDPENPKKTMTHYMEVSDARAYPRVVNQGGKLGLLSSDSAYKYAMKNKEYIQFKNDDEAVKFTENYKGGKKVKIGK